VGFKLAAKDVFLNITGGLQINDPAIDLAVICAILSSNVDMAIPAGWCMTGEVGLSGEIRPVAKIEQRVMEAEKLGMTDMLVPRGSLKGIDTASLNVRLREVARVDEAVRALFGRE
jgi:DNA repair protein RadA/Sms